MLKRKAENVLLDWLESKDALLITGARQVGKSYLVRNFLKDKFDHFVEINLYDHKDWIPVLEQAKNAEDLLFRITAFSSEDLSEGSTLIFFDEIQYLLGRTDNPAGKLYEQTETKKEKIDDFIEMCFDPTTTANSCYT